MLESREHTVIVDRREQGNYVPLLVTKVAHQQGYCSGGPIAARPRNREMERLSPAIRLLIQISGVGFKRAVALFNHFGSLEKIFAASEKDLCAVQGIGPSRAKAIRYVNQPGNNFQIDY